MKKLYRVLFWVGASLLVLPLMALSVRLQLGYDVREAVYMLGLCPGIIGLVVIMTSNLLEQLHNG